MTWKSNSGMVRSLGPFPHLTESLKKKVVRMRDEDGGVPGREVGIGMEVVIEI